jgi:F-type H+-transporting ATPase subunit b
MHTAVVAVSGTHVVSVHLQAEATTTTVAESTGTEATTAADSKEPSPLKPDLKEVFWGLGSFVVLLALMRLWLYPRVKAGMDARQDHIAKGLAEAAAVRGAAEAEVADYQAALAEVRAEAQSRVDAAAREVEADRAAQLAAANSAAAERKAAAATEIDAAKAAVAGRVAEAASDVVSAAASRVLGQAPGADAVSGAVQQVMGASR